MVVTNVKKPIMRQIKIMQYCKGAGRAVSRSSLNLSICNDLTCVSCKSIREAFDSAANSFISHHLKSPVGVPWFDLSISRFVEKVQASFTEAEIEELRENFKNIKIDSKLRKS